MINIETDVDNKSIIAIKHLFSLYPKNDIYYEIVNKGLAVNLRQLDFSNFKSDIEKLTKHYNGESKLLYRLLNSIADIKSYGLKGKKRLYVGYNKERKVKDREKKELKRGMFFYAANDGFSQTNSDTPKEFINKILCGNSEEILKQLPDNCVDLIFTSPPYNFGLEYTSNKDDAGWKEYFDKLFSIFDECIRILKFGGRIIVNTQPLFSDYIPSHHIISNYFMKKKLIWKGEILWEKNNYNCKYTAWGSWKSPSNPYLKYTWEFLEIFSKGTLKKSGLRENIDIEKDEFKKWVVAKWSIAPERKMKDFGHPAMFPEELVDRALKLFSYKNDIILDPFNGAGTTTIVAKKLGRKYIGIDISKEYCKKAETRIKQNIDLFNFKEKNG
ncbi:MAG TPA: DNA methylase [Elusimicrobia bacterium]|nr:DNA methylase [Elusimicrobiota bacterium]